MPIAIKRRHFGYSAAAALYAFAGKGRGFAADADFPERNIDFIIPKAPGGGFDNLVRVIAPSLEKSLPHKVSVVPDNIPAGGGGKGVGQLYRAKPDGHTIGLIDIPGSFILQQRQGGGVFDLNKITWLCSMGRPEPYCIATAETSSLKTVNDLRTLARTRPVKFTSSGPEGTAYAATVIANRILGIRIQLITGYKGSSDFVVGAIRGDGDAVIAPISSLRLLQKSKTLRIMATFEEKSSLPGVADATSLGQPDLSQIRLERLVGAPPGLPARVKAVLASAFSKAMADPQAVSLAKKLDVELYPNTPDQAAARVRDSAAFFTKWQKYLT
jgi:tripartite-type tricarboxylate transporter receptor subunit TctC